MGRQDARKRQPKTAIGYSEGAGWGGERRSAEATKASLAGVACSRMRCWYVLGASAAGSAFEQYGARRSGSMGSSAMAQVAGHPDCGLDATIVARQQCQLLKPEHAIEPPRILVVHPDFEIDTGDARRARGFL